MTRNDKGKTMKRTSIAAACVSLTLLLVPVAFSQEESPAADETSLGSELKSLNETMRQIADLLQRHLETNEVDVYLKRLELGRQKLAPTESELRSAKSKKEGVEDERKSLMAWSARLEEESEREDVSALDDSEDVSARMRRELETQVEQLKDKSWELDQKIIELENELARQKEDVEALEVWIDERLGLR